MRILLATPYLSWHDSGLLVAKSIVELQHPIFLWDFRTTPVPPPVDYDLAIVCTGGSVDPEMLKHPRVLIWNDNTFRNPVFREIAPLYDRVYTINQDGPDIPNWEWLPMGCDPDVHRPRDIRQQLDVVFIGTANNPKKPTFLRQLTKRFKGRLQLFGNNWDLYGMQAAPPQYFHNFAWTISAAKIALNLHWDLYGIGTNRKVHEIAGVGKALLLTDKVKGLNGTYPMAPCFTSVDECLELIQYYLDHDMERNKLVLEMQRRAYEKFTYKRQMQRILEEIW